MASNGYQSTWNPQFVQNQQNQNQQWNQWQMPQYTSNVIIVPIQGEEAVRNYIVGRGVTAFLIDYANRVFWKKRQTDDGLDYETVKHYFFTEDEYNGIGQNESAVSVEEFNSLKEVVMKLKNDLDELMK